MEEAICLYDLHHLSNSERIGLFRKSVDRCDEKLVEQADYCSNQRCQPINMTKSAILKKGWDLESMYMSKVERDNTQLIKVTIHRKDNASLEFFLTMYVEAHHLQGYIEKLTPTPLKD